MSQTQLHLLELLVILNATDEALHLETDAPHDFVGLVASLAGDAQLLLNAFAEFLFSNKKLIFNSLLNDVLVQELLQAFGHLAAHEFLNGFHGVLGVLELDESL